MTISEMFESSVRMAAARLKLSKLYRIESKLRDVYDMLEDVEVAQKIQEIENQIFLLSNSNYDDSMISLELMEVIARITNEAYNKEWNRLMGIYEMKTQEREPKNEISSVDVKMEVASE